MLLVAVLIVVGGAIAAAAVAGHERSERPSTQAQVSQVAAPIAGYPSSIASLGDSFNTGFAAGPGSGDDAARSWSTGSDPVVDSVYLRILAHNPRIRGHGYLVAVDGSKIHGLIAQAAAAAARQAAYITVQSGGNDLCGAHDASSETSLADFARSFQQAIDVLRTRLPDARILITSITDEGRWNDASSEVPANRDALSDASLCDPLLDSHGHQDPDRRHDIQLAEMRYDAILERICATDLHCRYDGGAFFNLAYQPNDVSSRDAFHPSVHALRRFAATAWQVGFAFADATPPTVQATVQPGCPASKVTLTGRDNEKLAGVEYRLGTTGPFSTATAPVTVQGGSSIDYRAVDAAGNSSATKRMRVPAAPECASR
jgi:hypothetical protein